MSFRARLTSFFVLIVVLPMAAISVLVFRLIDDSQRGQSNARVAGVATAALSTYAYAREQATREAEVLARSVAALPPRAVPAVVARLQGASGFVRVGVRIAGRSVYDRGSVTAVAPGVARVRRIGGGAEIKVAVSDLSAEGYVREIASQVTGVVLRQRGVVLASSFVGGLPRLPSSKSGMVTFRGTPYSAYTQDLIGYGKAPVEASFLTVATRAEGTTSRGLAIGFIVGFLVLAIAFGVLSSRGLQGQLRSFLQAARRLAAGDFSSRIESEGHDEFALLGQEFNRMSSQLEQRIEELGQERRRLRESLLRIGQLFASNLDRGALLSLALQTAVDSVSGTSGRLTSRTRQVEPLSESARINSLNDFPDCVLDAEREALRTGDLHQSGEGDRRVVAVVMRPSEPGVRAHGVITVARHGAAFSDDDLSLLRSLAAQAAVALENIEMHFQVSHQAVTDQLTGLANHGRFQDSLSHEVQQVHRYHHHLGLILLDIDNFKSVNDTYGHQQGDLVLRHVARVLRENSRDADVPARYGGEEMALILPHTDLEGAYAIAERVRTAISGMPVPLLEREGELRVTASLGVAALGDGEKDELIARADAALYRAKRTGKNRTERALPEPVAS